MTVQLAFTLLFASAVRAALLGAGVWALLRLARVRDTRSEILIWTAVLIASAGMPLLSRVLTDSIGVPLPSLWFLAPAASVPDDAVVSSVSLATPWYVATDILPPMLWALYGVVVVFGLARLATGLILTLRLYRTATPITAPWAADRSIRTSADVASPISFGSCILLPADYRTWPEAKLLAVLAHEQSHIRRGDFFIQLLAALHRALFWFSPYAWWLQKKLCELGEAASDEAAVRLLNDRTSYAEILIDVSRGAHSIPAQVAMAKSPNIHWRIDRILTETPEHHLSLAARILAVSAILPAACIIAGAHAAAVPAPAATRPSVQTQAAPIGAPAAAPRRPANAAPVRHVRNARPATGHPRPAYNPRALLEDGDAVIVPTLIPANAHGTKKNSGHAVVILNANGLADSGN